MARTQQPRARRAGEPRWVLALVLSSAAVTTVFITGSPESAAVVLAPVLLGLGLADKGS